jgi:hypothetical protein
MHRIIGQSSGSATLSPSPPSAACIIGIAGCSSRQGQPGDFGIVLVGFVLLTVWRAPPLLVVIISALGGIALAMAVS